MPQRMVGRYHNTAPLTASLTTPLTASLLRRASCLAFILTCFAHACTLPNDPDARAHAGRTPGRVHTPTSVPWEGAWSAEVSGARGGNIAPAPFTDDAYNSDESISVLRVVYRARARLPRAIPDANLGTSVDSELVIESDGVRLRAVFQGEGWPVPAGSEVRLRGDSGGSYVFDDQGGRALGLAELPLWWSGLLRPRNGLVNGLVNGPVHGDPNGPVRPGYLHPSLWLQRTQGTVEPHSELVCAFFRELVGQDRLADRSCLTLGAPLIARTSLWDFQRMAMVRHQVRRRTLRADQLDAPAIQAAPNTLHCTTPGPLAAGSVAAGSLAAGSLATESLAAEPTRHLVSNARSSLLVWTSRGDRTLLLPGHTLTIRGCAANVKIFALRPFGGAALTPTRIQSLDDVTTLRR